MYDKLQEYFIFSQYWNRIPLATSKKAEYEIWDYLVVKLSRPFTFKRLFTVSGNTLWSLSKTLFIFCRHKFSNFARPSYGSLVYSRGFANYFETKLSLGGGICDHTLDVASEHLHVTYFIAAIKINSRSFRMW